MRWRGKWRRDVGGHYIGVGSIIVGGKCRTEGYEVGVGADERSDDTASCGTVVCVLREIGAAYPL